MYLLYGEDSDVEEEPETYTLQELVPRSAPTPPPIVLTLPPPTPATTEPVAGPSHQVQPPAPQGKTKKRRRAISPSSREPPQTRQRLGYMELLATLSPENQSMVFRAAELGLNGGGRRTRVINERHAVSQEFPIPWEVR